MTITDARIAKILNSVYYREFDLADSEKILEDILKMDFDSAYQNNNVGDIVMLPYSLLDTLCSSNWFCAEDSEFDEMKEQVMQFSGKLAQLVKRKIVKDIIIDE